MKLISPWSLLLFTASLFFCGPFGCDSGEVLPEKQVPSKSEDGADMVSIVDGPLGAFAIDRFEFPNIRGQKPTLFVDLQQAVEACEGAGKRLCSAGEWRRACSGSDGAARFSYGPDYKAGVCHAAGELPSGYTSGSDATGLVHVSGAHPDCQSAEGVFDLIGNAEEWVLDDWNGNAGTLEGGAWYSLELFADCTGRYSRHPDFRLNPEQPVFSAGFRCCKSDAPLTQEAIQYDAKTRLKAAKTRSSSKGYNGKDEVKLASKTFIDRYEYPNQKGAFPLGAVSANEAETLCKEGGKRLCTSAEWQLACAGEAGLFYPYGDEFKEDACSSIYTGLRPSGTSPQCRSPGGAGDMAGGLWEWTASALALAERGDTATLREVRGGSYSTGELKTRCIPRDGYPAAPESAHYPDVGFRCCRGDVFEKAPTSKKEAEGVRYDCPMGMHFAGNTCVDAFEFPNQKGGEPQGSLDFFGAKKVCEGAGKHLCDAQEWQSLCSGASGRGAGRRWPYGDVYQAGFCNFGAAGRGDGVGAALTSGAKERCKTPEGIFDLSGNLWEWSVGEAGKGQLRGGGWNMNSGLGQCPFFAPSKESWSAPDTGARCCASQDEAKRLLKP